MPSFTVYFMPLFLYPLYQADLFYISRAKVVLSCLIFNYTIINAEISIPNKIDVKIILNNPRPTFTIISFLSYLNITSLIFPPSINNNFFFLS